MDKQMSIQEVSDRLGLPKSTLRYWEREFKGFITPKRTSGGQRRYSQNDLEILLSIRKHKKMGFSLTEIKSQLQECSPRHESFDPVAIEDLAERITATVKKEIYNFFEQSRNGFFMDNDNNALERE